MSRSAADKSSKAYSFNSLHSQNKWCSQEEKRLKMVGQPLHSRISDVGKAIASPFGRQEFTQQTLEFTRPRGAFHWETVLLANPKK